MTRKKTAPTKVFGVTVRADEETVKTYNEAIADLQEALARLRDTILVALKLRREKQ